MSELVEKVADAILEPVNFDGGFNAELAAQAAIDVIKAKLLSDEVVEAGANILYGFTENEKALDAKITKQILTAAIAKLESE
jgi:hypothetical protein